MSENNGHYPFSTLANSLNMARSLIFNRGNSSSEGSVSQPQTPTDSESNLDRFEPPPLPKVELEGYSTSTRSKVLTSEITEQIRDSLPPRMQLRDTWHLVYSLEQHGASLTTLYDRSRPAHNVVVKPPHVIVIKTRSKEVFGAYINEEFRLSEHRRFYGNGECFLWRLDNNGVVKPFKYTGANDFVIYNTPDYLSMGGGDGHYGLWVDQSLDKGFSSHTLTFDNEPLASNGHFEIIGLEVWRVG